MFIDLVEWLWDHRMEVTFNTLLLFILRKFILTELKRILRFNRTDAVLYNLKIIMQEIGVADQWKSSLPMNGFKIVLPQLSKKLYLFSRMETNQNPRRKNMLTTILKANLSKKLISVLVSMGIASLNSRFGWSIPESVVYGILGLSAAHITFQTIIDSIKAWALSKATTIVHTLPTVDDVVQKAIADPVGTHQDAVEIANSFIKTFNSVISNLKKNDNSLDYAESKSFLAELKVIEARYKPLEPLTTIPEQKVS